MIQRQNSERQHRIQSHQSKTTVEVKKSDLTSSNSIDEPVRNWRKFSSDNSCLPATNGRLGSRRKTYSYSNRRDFQTFIGQSGSEATSLEQCKGIRLMYKKKKDTQSFDEEKNVDLNHSTPKMRDAYPRKENKFSRKQESSGSFRKHKNLESFEKDADLSLSSKESLESEEWNYSVCKVSNEKINTMEAIQNPSSQRNGSTLCDAQQHMVWEFEEDFDSEKKRSNNIEQLDSIDWDAFFEGANIVNSGDAQLDWKDLVESTENEKQVNYACFESSVDSENTTTYCHECKCDSITASKALSFQFALIDLSTLEPSTQHDLEQIMFGSFPYPAFQKCHAKCSLSSTPESNKHLSSNAKNTKLDEDLAIIEASRSDFSNIFCNKALLFSMHSKNCKHKVLIFSLKRSAN